MQDASSNLTVVQPKETKYPIFKFLLGSLTENKGGNQTFK